MGREEKSTWGLAGATQDPSVPHHVPQDSPQSLRHAPCPSEYHPRECRRAAPLCYGTEPGAIPVSPTPLHLHTHGVPYPGDCKPGAMPGVLVPGVVPRTPSQRQGAAARCCAQGTAPRYGMPVGPGEPSQARRGEAGSRREPVQPEGLGVCRARCVLGGPGGTYPAPVPTQRGAGRPAGARARSVCAVPRFNPPRAAGTA